MQTSVQQKVSASRFRGIFPLHIGLGLALNSTIAAWFGGIVAIVMQYTKIGENLVPDKATHVDLLESLARLSEQVESVELTLDTPQVEKLRELRLRVLFQLTDYVIPRLVQLDAPMIVVVGGSTGAGKSTLVNSLVGEKVTESGILRPTTRAPILIHNPADANWFIEGRLLPNLLHPVAEDEVHGMRMVATEKIPPGLVIVDAPDINSIDRKNRALSGQLLKAADLWLFVSSAARYADAVPWQFLTEAIERNAAVAVVLDRTHPEAIDEVRRHLARMMTARGLSDSPLFAVPETSLDPGGFLPAEVVAPIFNWLKSIAEDVDSRQLLVRQGIDGAVRQLVFAAIEIADNMEAQLQATTMLYTEVEGVYKVATQEFANLVNQGGFFSGQISARWQEYATALDLKNLLAEKVRNPETRASSAELIDAIVHALASAFDDFGQTAADVATKAWREFPFGQSLLHPDLAKASADSQVRALKIAKDWMDALRDLVRGATEDKKMTIAFQSLSVNGLTGALAIHILTSGSEPSELSDLARLTIESVIDPKQVSDLTSGATQGLVSGFGTYLQVEKKRYLDLVPSPESIATTQEALREAARDAEFLRLVDNSQEVPE